MLPFEDHSPNRQPSSALPLLGVADKELSRLHLLKVLPRAKLTAPISALRTH